MKWGCTDMRNAGTSDSIPSCGEKQVSRGCQSQCYWTGRPQDPAGWSAQSYLTVGFLQTHKSHSKFPFLAGLHCRVHSFDFSSVGVLLDVVLKDWLPMLYMHDY